jgi:hypothetical protein
VHKTANVLNRLPKSQHTKAKRALQAVWMAADDGVVLWQVGGLECTPAWSAPLRVVNFACRLTDRIAIAPERSCNRPGQIEPFGDLAQHDDAAVRRQAAGIERGCEQLPSTADRPGKISVAFMAMGGGSGGDAHELLRHQIPTPTQRLRRRPSATSYRLTNKTG